VNEAKNESLKHQEKARVENENKPPPSKPILLQLQEKTEFLQPLIPADYRDIFEDSSLHLVFVDTENNSKKWTLGYCRELSFYSSKLNEWLFFDVNMELNHEAQMKDRFNQLLKMFPEPVVFVHYNYTENKLLQELFGRYEDLAPIHSYCDLLGLARALIDTKNPKSTRLYCITRNLAIIMKYWWKGKDYEIKKEFELLISTGRKSEMDVGSLYHLFIGIKRLLFK
jgi:hypothetical protein